MTKKDLIIKVEAAAKKHRRAATVLRDATNPQTKEVYARLGGMADAFESVLDALRGDSINLNIWARD